MIDLDLAAARLYPAAGAADPSSPAPADAPPAAATPAPAPARDVPDPAPDPEPEPAPADADDEDAQIAADFAALAERRAADPARRLYDDRSTYADALALDPFADVDLTDDQREATATGLATLLADTGVLPTEAPALIADYRAAVVAPEAERAGWPAAAMTALRQEFGDAAKQALADAQQLVMRDPALRKLLDHNRAGDNPTVVLHFARLGRAARNRGEFAAKGK